MTITANNSQTNLRSTQPFLKSLSEPGHDLELRLPTPPLPSSSSLNSKNKKRNQSTSSNLVNNTNDVVGKKICCCLFGNQKNDFYQTHNKRLNNKRISENNLINNQIKFNNLLPETKIVSKKNSDQKLVRFNKNNNVNDINNDSDQENTAVTFNLKPMTLEIENKI